MSIGVYYLESTNAAGVTINSYNREVVERLSALSGQDLVFTDLEHVSDHDLLMVFVGGGGVEGRFKAVVDQLPEPVFLLTTGLNNSLAASMEILSYLKQNDIPGEIIHGSEAKMAKRIADLAKVFKAANRIRNMRLARVGSPATG